MSYVTNDVNALQSAMVENTIEMITEGFILIGSVVAMIYLDWRLTLFTVCTFPVVLWFMEFLGKKSQNRRQNPGMYCGYYFGSAGVCGFCQSYQIICQGRLRG